MIYPTTYQLDIFGNVVAPLAHNSVPRSLAPWEDSRMGSEPTFASTHDPINQFQLPPPPPSALVPPFQHSPSTTIPRITSFLDFRELIWAQPDPIWNIQWSAPSILRSSYDSNENAGGMFGLGNHIRPLPSPISSTPTSVSKNVGLAHTAGLFNAETGATVTPLATGSNNKPNRNAGTKIFRPTGEAEKYNTNGSNQVSLAGYPSSGHTTVEREPTEPQHGGSYVEPVASQATVKGPGRGYRSDLKRDPRFPVLVPFVQNDEQSEVDETQREVHIPKVLRPKRKIDDEDPATCPPPPSKRQRRGKKGKVAATFDLEECAYNQHILFDHALLHGPMPSSTIKTAESLPVEHQRSHREEDPNAALEGHIAGPSNDIPSSQLNFVMFATDNVHGQANIQGARSASL